MIMEMFQIIIKLLWAAHYEYSFQLKEMPKFETEQKILILLLGNIFCCNNCNHTTGSRLCEKIIFRTCVFSEPNFYKKYVYKYK